MHIALDGHAIGTQLAGNATYITGLLESLAGIDRTNRYTVYVCRDDVMQLYRDRWPNVRVRKIGHEDRLRRFLFSFRRPVREDRPDIFFAQFNAPTGIDCKIVTAIHDLSFEHLPETFRWHESPRMKLTIRRTARLSAHIVACSESSRQDIIRTYKIAPDKVSTVPLAVSPLLHRESEPARLAAVRKKYDLPDRFILGLGSVQPRKNLDRLIAAYAQLAGTRDMPTLVLAGKLAWLYADSVAAPAKYGVSDRVIFTGFVPDEDLSALYSAATCFVYPSFFEGFGLPPLEAMQCGTPVITGDRTSLPEVVGDAGIMVDPFDVAAIANAVDRVLNDEKLRATLSAKGLERAKTFSWERTARATLDVFERVMSVK